MTDTPPGPPSKESQPIRHAATGTGQRVDGILKVTGQAVFAADEKIAGLCYGRLVTSPIGRGRITRIDDNAALAVPGVIAVFTHENIGTEFIRYVKHSTAGGYANSSLRPLSTAKISYHGQIVALVVATSLAAAEDGAARLKVDYQSEPGVWHLQDQKAVALSLKDLQPSHKDRTKGYVDSALKASATTLEAVYETPVQHHNPIELFITTCVWNGPKLTIYEPARFVGAVQHGVAAQLGMDAKNVRVVARYIGGHFGSKFGLPQYTAIAAVAAKKIGRPVMIASTRKDGFTIANHRPDTRHHISLGADATGKLTALRHEAVCSTSRFDLFAMEGTDVTSALYACPNIETKESVAQVDRNTPGPMRAPPEVPYLFALESAIDELACKLDLDPIELRRINDTDRDPVTGKAFTTRHLMECFAQGAKTFEWSRRQKQPCAVRDGDWLVGLGCASAARPVKIGAAVIRLALTAGDDGDLQALVETAHHEIGNGLYTILAMTVAQQFDLPIEKVTVHLGDTELPPAGVSGGSSTTTTLINGLVEGCNTLRNQLGVANSFATILKEKFNGHIETIIDYLPAGMKPDAIEKLKDGHFALGSSSGDKLAWTFGAQFVEVRVNALTGEIRVPKMVGCFAAGKIINQLTAHSQLTGGMVWGLSSALFEASHLDEKTGGYVNNNLGDYLVPVSADVNELIATFVEDEDSEVNPEGIKGVGEIGLIGVNAAIANAVYNATGKRIRRLPIRAEDML